MKMEQTECSETSAYKIPTPGNYPEESIQHSEHGKSLKPRSLNFFRQIFEKYLKIKFLENPCSGNRLAPCWKSDGRTDRQIWRKL